MVGRNFETGISLTLALSLACTPASPPTGDARMRERLAEIARRTPDENPDLGDAKARRLREQLATSSPAADPIERWRLLYRLSQEELNLGRDPEAIAHLSEAYELLPQVRDRLRPHQVVESVFRLGVAHFRNGEVENCRYPGVADRCILPIRDEATHVREESSRRAIVYFAEVCARTPPDSSAHLRSRWLLNLAYMTVGDYPDRVPEELRIPPATFRSEASFPRLRNVARDAGLDAIDLSGAVVADDFDGDGDIDVLTATIDPRGGMRYYRSRGDGSFDDGTRQARLEGLLGGLNMVQADYDNDGDIDVLVLRGAWWGPDGRHPNSLLRNDGTGTFTDVTFDVGLSPPDFPTQTATWADYDLDGDVDLFVGNENHPCQLFRNDGGRFRDVGAEAGVAYGGFTKAAVFGDYDGDRYPDLFLSNLGETNRLFRNRGDGTFADVTDRAGVAAPEKSFPAWFFDYDNDGRLDLFVSAYSSTPFAVADVAASYLDPRAEGPRSRLYRGDGNGGFEDVTSDAGLHLLTLSMGANFGDFDADGYLDFYLGTGYPDYAGLVPNVFYRNRGGAGFEDVSFAAGVAHLQKGHAVAFFDHDGDGDLDLFERMGGALAGDVFADALFDNPGFPGTHRIELELEGRTENRSAIGARVRVDVGGAAGPRTIRRTIGSGGSFGANPLTASIGLGDASRIERVEIFWPRAGRTQVVPGIELDHRYRVVEGEREATDLGDFRTTR